jgi:hypothetical protein
MFSSAASVSSNLDAITLAASLGKAEKKSVLKIKCNCMYPMYKAVDIYLRSSQM